MVEMPEGTPLKANTGKGQITPLDDITHPILYSTMTMVAYNVNLRYYKGLHYMWCTPYFSSNFQSPHYTVPPSSSPFEIYRRLRDEISSADQHDTKIELNRLGILKGAHAMRDRGIITPVSIEECKFAADSGGRV